MATREITFLDVARDIRSATIPWLGTRGTIEIVCSCLSSRQLVVRRRAIEPKTKMCCFWANRQLLLFPMGMGVALCHFLSVVNIFRVPNKLYVFFFFYWCCCRSCCILLLLLVVCCCILTRFHSARLLTLECSAAPARIAK